VPAPQVRVLRTVSRDVVDDLIEVIDHTHGKNRRQIFGVPVFYTFATGTDC